MVEKIITLTAEHLGISEDGISATSSFKEDLGVDSLDLFELVMELEEKGYGFIEEELAAKA